MRNVLATTDDQNAFVTIYKVQICTGSISFLASMAMATSIQFSKRKLSTPYRRLVYGLCVSDIIQSISIITGPFAPPTEAPYAFWARGNIATCDVNGLMFSIGFTAVPMYVLALSVYYFYKLKRRMRDEVFRKKYEVWIHSFIILWHLSTNIISLSTETFNPEVSGSYCFPNEFPVNCNISPEIYGECERGNFARIVSITCLIGPCIIISVSVGICMGRLMYHAYSLLKLSPPSQNSTEKKKRQIFRSKRGPSTGRTVGLSFGDAHDSVDEGKGAGKSDVKLDTVQDQNDPRVVVQELSTLYRREMLIQALSFIAIFVVIYTLPFAVGIMNILKIKPSPIFMTALSGIYPLGGLFNILVHTRPNIAALRRRDGYQGSWPRAFLQVLLAGGDIPEVASKPYPFDANNNAGVDNMGDRIVGPLSVTNFGPGRYHVKSGFKESDDDENLWSNERLISYELSSVANAKTSTSNQISFDESKVEDVEL